MASFGKSWLASQLQKAENLLEAVDRTVSTATGQQLKPTDTGDQAPLSSEAGSGHDRLASEAFASLTAQGATPGSPAYSSPSKAIRPVPSAVRAGSTARSSGPGSGGTPPAARHQQPLWQPAAAGLSQVLSAIVPPAPHPAPASHGPQQPTSMPPGQPSSTGSYTVRTHGPFSPTPDRQQELQQSYLHPPKPPGLGSAGSWGPPPPAAPPVPPSAAVAPAVITQPALAAAAPAASNVAWAADMNAVTHSETAVDLANNVHATQQHADVASNDGASGAVVDGPRSNGAASNTRGELPGDTDQRQQDLLHAEGSPSAERVDSADSSSNNGGAPESSDTATRQMAASSSVSSNSSRASESAEAAPAAASIAAALQAALQEQHKQQQLPQQAPVEPAASHSSQTAESAAALPQLQQQQLQPANSTNSSSAHTSGPPSNSAPSGNEAQLMRLVETLRKRLDQVKAENQQLEDLVHAAEQSAAAEQQRTQQLIAEMASMQRAQDEIVSSAAANAAAQDAQVGRLQQDLDAANRQVAALQGALEAIQEQHQQVLSSKDSIEGGALEAVRSELAAAEAQLESERKAHAATKAAATTRERDLEEQLASSSEALAVTQRQLEELAGRGRELEEQQALGIAEAARLREQVRQLSEQHTFRHELDPAQQLQLEAEREALTHRLNEAQAAVLAATQAQRAAEAQAAALQQEIAHIHSSYQASAAARGPPQLEQQVHELQELLYQKQQQLERLSGEKQAQQLLLERQVATLRSELGRAHAAAAAAQTSGSFRGAHDIIPMDALGEPYQRLARHRKLGGAVQATANFLDRTAASASQLLRQQPLARLIVFLYIILIHVYVYFLLARMQRQAVMMLAGQEKGTAGHEPVLPGTH